MSLYQCKHCGCCENTALGMQPGTPPRWFDWTGIEHRRGMELCSACMPTRFADGTSVPRAGGWHGQFERVFLPKGMFKTNARGNLEHIETGTEDFRAYAIEGEAR
ncbi:hypothetical protein [Burkholderia gladioli]|uniref:hypothetical protein n=1 Tax=Burkholderia gladioli TaxID=28095 RepID=UPI0016403791|nr:hypothetical protein [Burkholderia gladioli]